MNFAYIIEAGLVHLVLYLGYLVFLRKQTDYKFLRSYLIGAIALALVVPLFELPILPATGTLSRAQEILLEPVFVTGTSEAETASGAIGQGLDWTLLPALVSIAFLISLTIALGQIIKAFTRSRSDDAFGISVRVLDGENKSFTFLRYIFSPEEPVESVIRHEKGHADLLHSVDVLLLNVFKIFFWWTPSCWWTMRELRLIHEFQADEKALQETSYEDYKKILISRTLSSMNLNLASSFHHGALLKRLNAMQAKRESINKWRLGVLGILVATTVIVFSCADSEIQEIAANANMSTTYPASVEEMLGDLKTQFPDKDFSVIEVLHEDGVAADLGTGDDVKFKFNTKIKEELHELVTEHKTVHYAENSTSGELMYVIVENSNEFVQMSEAVKSEDGIYTLVEEQPSFDGGINKFYEYVGSNMSYPDQARKLGIEGTVYVQMVVNEDGSVSDVEVAKGIGAGCDLEAARVIANSPKWNAGKMDGKDVKVKMMIPIVYKLNTHEVKEVPPPPPPLEQPPSN